MEEEVAELLRAAGAHTGEAVEEAEEALALKVGYLRHHIGRCWQMPCDHCHSCDRCVLCCPLHDLMYFVSGTGVGL